MFGLFNKKPEIITEDKIWKNDTYKFNALKETIRKNNKLILVYFFQDTKAKAIHLVEACNIQFTEQIDSSNQIVIIHADNLQKLNSNSEKSIIFLEHHPSFATEQIALNHLLNLGYKKVEFLSSFDDPILNYFGKNIVSILERMGFKDDEVIQHNMITQSIKNAQKKIDQKVSFPNNTRNAKDWIASNLGENFS